MKRVNLLAIAAILFGLSTLVSCTTDLATTTDAALTETAIDEGQAATVNDQVVSSADEYLNNLDASGYQAVNAALNSTPQKTSIKIVVDSVTITVDRVGLNDYPKNICIDFGTGVTVKRGNVLKGKIYITVSGKMTIANSSRTFQFSNFYVNDNAVKGHKVVTYMGLNTDSKPYWTISASDTITRADNKQVIWNSQRVRTRIDNNQTPFNYTDDVYSITGASNGVNAKGAAYTMTIQDSNPLIINSNYKYFTKGTVVITSESKTVVVDYGEGTKDNKATATINGVTKEFTLKK
jgi:hypothetical protein